MAQPKNRRRRDEKEVSPERKERENLEKKADLIIQKRNEFNDQANVLRGERDLLNNRRKEMAEQMDVFKAERDAHNAKLREHKERRNEFQAQAKSLIAKQRGTKRQHAQVQSPVLRAKELESDIRELEYEQQTTVLTVKEENKLIDSIRKKRVELKNLQLDAAKAARLDIDLRDTSQAIDQLFAAADAEHQEVLKYHKLSNEAHEKFVALFKDTAQVIANANAKHQEFVAVREKADAQHQQFLELRSKILELKGKDIADRREARAIIQEQRRRVSDAVANPERLAEHAEQSLDALKKGGKIRLG